MRLRRYTVCHELNLRKYFLLSSVLCHESSRFRHRTNCPIVFSGRIKEPRVASQMADLKWPMINDKERTARDDGSPVSGIHVQGEMDSKPGFLYSPARLVLRCDHRVVCSTKNSRNS